MAIYRRVGRLKLFSSRCAEASAVQAHIRQYLPLVPLMLVGEKRGRYFGPPLLKKPASNPWPGWSLGRRSLSTHSTSGTKAQPWKAKNFSDLQVADTVRS
jgi:hypothetical protein